MTDWSRTALRTCPARSTLTSVFLSHKTIARREHIMVQSIDFVLLSGFQDPRLCKVTWSLISSACLQRALVRQARQY